MKNKLLLIIALAFYVELGCSQETYQMQAEKVYQQCLKENGALSCVSGCGMIIQTCKDVKADFLHQSKRTHNVRDKFVDNKSDISPAFSKEAIITDEIKVHCLVSNRKTGAIKLQLNLLKESNSYGSVQYKDGDGKILVKKYEEKIISSNASTIANVKSSWKEFVDGNEMGTYILLTTGGRVKELTYINKNKTKIYKFYEDSNPYDDSQCWESN